MKIEKKKKEKRISQKRIAVTVFRNWKFPRFDDSSRFLPIRHLLASISLVGQWDWLDPSIRNRVQWPCRGEAILRSTGHLSWAAPWIMGFVDELNPIGPVFNSLAHRLTRERRLSSFVGSCTGGPSFTRRSKVPVIVRWIHAATPCPPLFLSLRVPRLVAS